MKVPPQLCQETCPVTVNTMSEITKALEKYEANETLIETQLPRIMASLPREAAAKVLELSVKYSDQQVRLIDGGSAFLTRLAETCIHGGPLELRDARDDTVFEVTVCTADAVPDEPREPTFVRRTPLE